MHQSGKESLALKTANRMLQNDLRDSLAMERDEAKAESFFLERSGAGRSIRESKK